jgi:hypothetical protein
MDHRKYGSQKIWITENMDHRKYEAWLWCHAPCSKQPAEVNLFTLGIVHILSALAAVQEQCTHTCVSE